MIGNRILLCIGVIALTAIGLSGCGSSKGEGPLLATYDGGSITEGDFRQILRDLPERVRQVALRQKKDFLESYIIEKLLLREAEGKGIQHLKDVASLVRQARDRILVTKLIEREVEKKVEVPEGQSRAFYDAHKDDYVTPFRLKASHILLRSREEAETILRRLKEGAPFEDLAKQNSLDPTAAQGGDIGYFQKGQLIPRLRKPRSRFRSMKPVMWWNHPLAITSSR